ncbi:PREDICTED: apolipoprotein L3-like [Chrysochloris asiatica]|uniref:Apolipoprotein L3-like n=1 Tax=Chrysochloris asiatica TaxID=185453 RepID=A0A9B0TJ60_CHRAS|nr:PREDICTED: apolipoprotein L3-like [Chrysochloris asiatica]
MDAYYPGRKLRRDTEEYLSSEYYEDTVSQEQLQLLMTDDQAWEKFMVEAGLTRNEADALYETLNNLSTDMAIDDEDEDMLQTEQLNRERFFNDFPEVKMKLEERIRKLHQLADKVDKIHRDCTISNIASTSAGIISGVLTIASLALAPMTAGVSLGLMATGVGLRAAATVTSVSTSIVEESSKLSAKSEASKLLSTDINIKVEVEKVVSENTPKLISTANKCIQASKQIEKSIQATKLAKVSPRLAANSRRLMTGGNISVRSGRQMQKAFGGTALAMTKAARIMGMATTGIFIMKDVVNLVEQSKHLHEGAKEESAEELRQQAQELEKVLEILTQIHQILPSEVGSREDYW